MMKLLLLFFLVGYATAYDSALEEVAENVFTGLMLQEAEEAAFSMYAEDDVTTEAGKKLQEMLDSLLERIRDKMERGKEVKDKVLQKVKEIREKLKEMRIDMGEKARELLEKVRERVRNMLDEFMRKIGGEDTKEERSVEDDEFDLVNQLATSRLRDLFNKLKGYLRDQIDKEKLKEKVEEIFGKGNDLADSLLDIIKTKGDKYKDKLHELIDKYLGKEKRSLKEYWEKIKNYFKDLHIDLKERYSKFGEWVKDQLSKGITASKDRMENIKQIAHEFITHTKGVSKDVAAEALEFMKPYKEDLGSLWNQFRDTVKDILKRQD